MRKSLAQAIAQLLVRMSRYQPFQAWLHRVVSAYKQTQTSCPLPPGVEIPEITPIDVRVGKQQEGTRINLLVPALSSQHVFGGIETALQVFDELRHHFDHVRIIATDEAIPEPRPGAYYGQWPIIALDSDPLGSDHIVAAGSRWGKTLSVHEQDYFMATAWWTAHNAFSILSWQQRQYPSIDRRRLLYLIQDFEPGFYPWSTRYVLAQATYALPERTIAVINSEWLADYLHVQGHRFSTKNVLHPQLHPKLTIARNRLEHFQKERILLVYGRPGTERNAFALIVVALRLWAQSYADASKWQILSAGESFSPIELGHECQLKSVGKLGIEDYANLLSRSAVGLSLMVSPHPSYPPLEMAAFGVRVVTNGFVNKDLSKLSSFLISVDQPDPSSLSQALSGLTRDFDAHGPVEVAQTDVDWKGNFLQSTSPPTTWIPDVVNALLNATSPSDLMHADADKTLVFNNRPS